MLKYNCKGKKGVSGGGGEWEENGDLSNERASRKKNSPNRNVQTYEEKIIPQTAFSVTVTA